MLPPASPPDANTRLLVFPTPFVTPMTAAVLRIVASALLLAPVLGAQQAPDRRADSTAVVKAAEALLQAISTRDTALARRVMLPGAQLASITDPASPTSGGRMQTDTAFLTTLATAKTTFLERMWSPSVTLFGSLAVVSAPYDFYNDKTFSHCGTDVFTLVRSRGEWRITHVVYTTQRAGCAASPLGVPK